MKHRIAIKISLFFNYCIFAVLLNSVGNVILQVQGSFGVSESSASVLEAFKDLSIAIASFLVASFVARMGYKRTMLVGLTIIFVASISAPQLPSFLMTKIIFAATGVSFALMKVSVFATLGLVTKGQREHASWMNFLEAFFMVGVLSGYFIFAAFVDDQNPASVDWFNFYYLVAAASLLAFLFLLSVPLDESEISGEAEESIADSFSAMLKLCVKPLVLTFVLSVFLYVLIEQGIMSWLPTFNNKILSLPASLSIQMASILAISIALGRFIAGFAVKRIHWYPLLVITIVAAGALVLVALPLAGSVDKSVAVTSWFDAPLAAFIFPLIGLCLAPIYPIINSVILSSLPKTQHAPMTGLIVVFSALGGTTGSLITGNLFEHFDGSKVFYFSLVPMLVILVILKFFKSLSEKQDA